MKLPRSAEDALSSFLPAEVTLLDGPQAAEVLGRVKALRGYLDSYEARVTSRIAQLHARGESAPAADLHTRDGGVSSKEAQQKERRAEALDRAPSLADKLADGEVTAGHADAVANVTARLDEETRELFFDHEEALAADATRTTPEEFAKNCRDLIAFLERDQGIDRDRQRRKETRVSKRVDRDGMYVLNARLHPELGTMVFNAIDAETARLIHAGGDRDVDRQHVAAEALGNLVAGGHRATRPHEAEIRVHVDVETIIDGPHPGGVCEYDDGSPLPPATVRRLLCNGRIVPIIIDTNGVALDVGREQRLANRHQRRALRAMYRTCAFPRCDVEFNRCEIHHLVPFELGGLTDLAWLLPLCCRHHHVIHDPGWRLELDADRTLTVYQPDGAVFSVRPLRSPGPVSTCERASGAAPPGGTGPPGRPPDQLTLIA